MKIKDMMNLDIETVSPDTLLHEVARKMRKNDSGYVLVAVNDRLVGIVTDRDLALRCVAEGLLPTSMTAEEVMGTELLYCQETDEAVVVADSMSENKVRRLIVLNSEKRMVGTVALGDIALVKRAKTLN